MEQACYRQWLTGADLAYEPLYPLFHPLMLVVGGNDDFVAFDGNAEHVHAIKYFCQLFGCEINDWTNHTIALTLTDSKPPFFVDTKQDLRITDFQIVFHAGTVSFTGELLTFQPNPLVAAVLT